VERGRIANESMVGKSGDKGRKYASCSSFSRGTSEKSF